MSRRNRNGKVAAELKEPKNLYLTAETLAQGEELGAATNRKAFGNVVEWLIAREWKRRFGKAPGKKVAA